MSDDEHRVYSEEEFALILRTAWDLQARAPHGAPSQSGLALSDIKEIAADVGIDAEFVERAAAIARNTGVAEGPSLAGGPLRTFDTVEIAGELGENDLSRLIDLVRETMAGQGTVTEALGSVQWSLATMGTRVHVTLSTRDGATQVQVRADQLGTAFFSYFSPAFVVLVSASIVGWTFSPDLMGALGLVGFWGVGRTIFKHYSDRFLARLGSLTDRLLESGNALASESGEAESAVGPPTLTESTDQAM